MVAVLTDTYAPFDAGAGSNVMEGTWRKFMSHMMLGRSGVLKGAGLDAEVFGDSTGMQVKVRTGEFWLRGHWAEVTSTKTLTVPAAHSTLSRIDRVVVRVDFSDNEIELDVVEGTAASSPTAPAVTQDSSIWEVSLATVSVPAGDTSIGSNQVTDARFYANASYARYYASGSQTLSNNSQTQVDFHTTDVSTGDVTKVDNDTFELNRSGWWNFDASVRFGSSGSGYRQVFIGLSDDIDDDRVAEVKYPGDSSNHSVANVSGSKWYEAGTRVCVVAFQNRGTSMSIVDDHDSTYFAMTWLGP
jgi:hypothetical protein